MPTICVTLVRDAFEVPFPGACMHEFVLSGRRQRQIGVRTLDLAKRLIDYGYHPPTVYFPLIVDECMMVEPTETEDRETLDAFAAGSPGRRPRSRGGQRDRSRRAADHAHWPHQ